MRATRSASTAWVAALLLSLLASPSSAQDRVRRGAPNVRVHSQNGPGVESNYVTPAIEVSEDAYVFAVSMDLDGQIRILHPDFPGISVRILQHKQLRLPNFFAGFSQPGGTFDASGRYASYSDYAGEGNDSRGTVIALASRAPFNIERVERDGDWNISAIRRLIEHRTPGSAAQALASYLGAKGEPIGRDYMRFASARRSYYASNALYACDLYYGGYSPSLAFSRLAVLNRVSQLRHGGQSVSILGYDFCGMPIVVYGPSRSITGFRPATPPTNPGDTGARNRLPNPIPRSGPQAGNTPRAAAIGYFPITRRAEPPQMGDVTITAPGRSGRDPREILIDLRNEARDAGLPERTRVPVERIAPTRTETTVIGTQPIREYSRPVLREAPSAPPRPEPTRGPDRSPPPPPPVVQERPSSPPPPPPRASEPHSRPEADPPPPRR